uniref:Uncharacterized protein n=1 Tax=Arundo donax TaxID=35708 RepID=A0A0A8YJI8_ARUDO
MSTEMHDAAEYITSMRMHYKTTNRRYIIAKDQGLPKCRMTGELCYHLVQPYLS